MRRPLEIVSFAIVIVIGIWATATEYLKGTVGLGTAIAGIFLAILLGFSALLGLFGKKVPPYAKWLSIGSSVLLGIIVGFNVGKGTILNKVIVAILAGILCPLLMILITLPRRFHSS